MVAAPPLLWGALRGICVDEPASTEFVRWVIVLVIVLRVLAA